MSLGEPDIAAFLAAFVRCVGLLQGAPFVGDRMVPGRVRVGLAVFIAIALTPLRTGATYAQLPLVIPGELLLGLAAGFAGRLALAGVEAGGQLIGLQLELGFAGTFDPTLGDESLPTRRIAHSLAGLAFLSCGGLDTAIRALAVPAVTGRSLTAALGSVIERSAEVLPYALRLCAPLIVAALVANLAAALASRATPALNIFSVSLALVLLVGGFALLATAPFLARELVNGGRHTADVIAAALGAAS